MATKQEERNALAVIRNIVAELGEDSYVATAFEGCFTDAEMNIENDFACSMKQRWNSAVASWNKEHKELDDLKCLVKEKDDTIAALKKKLGEAKKQQLDADDLAAVLKLLRGQMQAAQDDAAEAAEIIIQYAEETFNPKFTRAVAEHRAAKQEAERLAALIKRLDRS